MPSWIKLLVAGIAGDRRAFMSHWNGTALQFALHPSHPALWLMRMAAQAPPAVAVPARQVLVVTYGCDVQHGAKLAPGLVLPHPLGIVIGGGCRVEPNVVLYQHVTLGWNPGGFPVVRAGATLFPGSVVAGDIEIGEGAQVSANALVLSSVPPRTTARTESSATGDWLATR